MSVFVPAASVAAAWLFDDEDEPRADAALATLDTSSPEPPSPELPSPKSSH